MKGIVKVRENSCNDNKRRRERREEMEIRNQEEKDTQKGTQERVHSQRMILTIV